MVVKTKKELSDELETQSIILTKLQEKVTDLESDFQHHMDLHEGLRANAFQQAHLRADAKPVRKQRQKGETKRAT